MRARTFAIKSKISASSEAQATLLEEKVDTFLQDEKKSVMLIHGPAGSGKTTFSKRLLNWLWLGFEKGRRECKQGGGGASQRKLLLPVRCDLAAMQRPTTDMVDEAMRGNFGRDRGRKESVEFRKYIKEGTYCPVFICLLYTSPSPRDRG